jgi:hypothetical protein
VLFQNTELQLVSGIPGVVRVCDDILVHASSVAEQEKELNAVVNR